MKKYTLFIFLLLPIVSILGICASILAEGGPLEKKHTSGSLNPPRISPLVQSVPQDKDRGIGPVKTVELGPINKKMTDDGKSIFNTKCIICHDLDQKKVGPPIRNITKDRTPEYIMNMMVNYAQMLKEDPILKDQFKRFNNVPMTDPALNQTQARSLLEYLRSVAK
jgi:cytochrome c551/c552